MGPRLFRQKMQRSLPRETNRTKKSMSTTAQTYWPSSTEIWEGQRNYSLKNEVDKDAISCFFIRKDWRFAVRAKSFALHWRSRGFFRGHVRSCEKGLCCRMQPSDAKPEEGDFHEGLTALHVTKTVDTPRSTEDRTTSHNLLTFCTKRQNSKWCTFAQRPSNCQTVACGGV